MAQEIVANFNTQNWLITPAVSPNAQTSPTTWLIVLSGVAVANFTGVSGTEFTILITPDVAALINFAVTNLGAPRPTPKPGDGFITSLDVEQWAPYAAVGSTFDESHGTADAGFDVNTWRPNPFFTDTDAATGLVMNQIFTGIQVDMSVRVTGPIVYRLPYNITLLARFVWRSVRLL
jgi:hypothetical protein